MATGLRHFIQYHHKSWLLDPVTLYNITISHGYRTRHFIQYHHKSWLLDPVTLYNIIIRHGYRTRHFIQYHHKSWLPDSVTLYDIAGDLPQLTLCISVECHYDKPQLYIWMSWGLVDKITTLDHDPTKRRFNISLETIDGLNRIKNI